MSAEPIDERAYLLAWAEAHDWAALHPQPWLSVGGSEAAWRHYVAVTVPDHEQSIHAAYEAATQGEAAPARRTFV